MSNHTTNEPTPQLTKVCSKCGEEKPATTEYFSRHKKEKDGLNGWCKKCTSKANRDRYEANRDEILAKQAARRATNPEKVKAAKKAEYQRNKDKYIDRANAWIANNRELFNERGRKRYSANRDKESERKKRARSADPEAKEKDRQRRSRNRAGIVKARRKYTEANKDKVSASRKKYIEANPDVARAYKQRRRARKLGLPDNFTAQDWRNCLDYFNGCCAVCDRPLYGILHKPHCDHWVPLAHPDCPGTIVGNMICLCGGSDGCNQSKGGKHPNIWLKERFGDRKSKQIAKKIQAYFDSLA